ASDGQGADGSSRVALKPRWKTSRLASLRIGWIVKEPSPFWVIPALVTYVAWPLWSARTPRSSASPLPIPAGVRTPMRTPPPTSVAQVKSSFNVVVTPQEQPLSRSRSVEKYEKPPATNPYRRIGPDPRASCGPIRRELTYDLVV